LTKILITLAALAALAGCISERANMSRFEPYDNDAGRQMFRLQADTASLMHPEASPDAEAMRIRWIEEYLRLNKLCPQGYVILDRQAVVRAETWAGPSHTITYTGACVEDRLPQ
jgi:hypothetical protein